MFKHLHISLCRNEEIVYYKLSLRLVRAKGSQMNIFTQYVPPPALEEWFDPDCCNASVERRYILNTLQQSSFIYSAESFRYNAD